MAIISRSAAGIALAAAAIFSTAVGAAAQQKSGMFAGKNISLLIGAGAGGGADTYARLFGRHVGRHLPGNPSIVPKNMQGAGGMLVANHLYNVSPHDGTVIGMFATSGALQPLFRNPKAKFDTVKFTWIGNMDYDDTVCATWKTAGVKTWQDLKKKEIRFGAGSPLSATGVHPKIVGAILGVKVKVIHGYRGTKASNLAMQRGEVDGICGLFVSTIKTAFFRHVESGDMTVWMTFGKERAPDFPKVPTIYEAAKTKDDRMLAELVFGQAAIGRPLAAPPGLSAETSKALRRGFDAAMKDPALHKEAKRLRLGIKPMTGEDTEARFKDFYAFPKAVVDRFLSITSTGKKKKKK